VSPPGGLAEVRLSFGRGKAQAREELATLLHSILGRLEALETAPPPVLVPLSDRPEELNYALAKSEIFTTVLRQIGTQGEEASKLEERIKRLTVAVDEGIERVGRSERRINATVARARKELKKLGYEDPGLEAEAAELRLVDGGGGEGGELPEVREGVEPADAPSSIRGVSAAQLRRVRGIG